MGYWKWLFSTLKRSIRSSDFEFVVGVPMAVFGVLTSIVNIINSEPIIWTILTSLLATAGFIITTHSLYRYSMGDF